MTHTTQFSFGDSAKAFADAIREGKLNTDPSSDLYAANWMYMGTINGEDQFKNIMTRKYLRSLTPGFVDA